MGSCKVPLGSETAPAEKLALEEFYQNGRIQSTDFPHLAAAS